MNKIFLIIQREYLSRVKKKSFIIMSVLGPVLFAAFLIVPTWLATMEDKEEKLIAVIDDSTISYDKIPETEYIKFKYLTNTSLDSVKSNFEEQGYYGVLYIPANILSSNTPLLYTNKQPSLGTTSHITNALEKEIETLKLKAENIDNLDEILQSVKTRINLRNITLSEEGKEKESVAEIAMGVGYIGGFLIYFFIFLFGAMVMRGVIEEKTSRIVEVIISSVKPFQLMMGKIVGIGMVGLTQFIIWVALTLVLITGVQKFIFPTTADNPQTTIEMPAQDIMNSGNSEIVAQTTASSDGGQEFISGILDSLHTVPLGLVLGMFIFYFIFGYLLYASFFAIIGSAVDNETDTQQFMLPVTLPLIIGIFVMINTIQNPGGPIAFWFSMIPFTSPIVMMVRIPFEPPIWEIALSGLILVVTFIGAVWMAGKIYRTGILMYGKKVNYAELWKWLRYKN
jgi:ABC-2 type transport system permease protein